MQRNRIISDELMKSVPTEEGMSAAEWLAEQMPGGFFIYRADESMELLYVNQSTCDIFGCETVDEFRELTGNNFRGMVHPEDYDNIQNSIDEQIARESNRRNIDYVVYRIIRKDGVIRWVDDYGHFASLPGYGEVYYVFIEDITENKIAEEEKEKSRNLALALEQAEHANVAKSAFLSNMSHEIRTPITAMLGMNEMIQRETDNSTILDYSENIRKAGVSLLGIISDILDFSKIETGRMELEYDEYSLSSLVVDLYNLVQFRTEAKGLELDFIIDPNLPSTFIGDEIRIKQIATNLLTNAVKYTEKGRVVFEISLLEKKEDKISMLFSVTDTGIGIRDEDMIRLFEPFDRLDLKKTRSIEGSGLGLAITRQLLSLMDSELKVESEYEKGSRFYFVLNQEVSDWKQVGVIDPNEHIHESSENRRKQPMFTAPGLNLLIVDDTPMNLQVIAGLLKRTKMHIDVAISGAECIDKFGREHYDLVFLDYRMPQMNGIETLMELKRRYPEQFDKTPIISLTASAVSGDKEKMIKAGFSDYLSKPVNIEDMERMMMKYLPSDSIIISDKDNEVQEEDEIKLPSIIYDYPQLDPQRGLEYCGDADDYLFAIETYLVSIDAKADQIEENWKNEDYDDYILNVHSLKSTSVAIGAIDLSEKAKKLEMAAKNGEEEMIRQETPTLLRDYRELKDILKTIINSSEMSDDPNRTSLSVVEEERSKMLARALEEAERANYAKTTFLLNMSHEIRTPMNAIIGLYNLALRKPDIDDDTRDVLVKIGASAKHLTSLINDVLDMSLIESGYMKLNNEEFSFGGMLEQINSMAEAKCDDKGLVYDCSVIGNVDDFYIGDDMKLKQLLFNIIDNAIKFTEPQGEVDFIVEETGQRDGKAMIRFSITDTGSGIDPEYLPHLFEPFSKEFLGTSNTFGSTGLGMSITKNIVDMMNGTIDVSSKKDEGTTFTVTIPLEKSRKPEHGRYQFDPKSLRALIVDDDITACEHAQMVLGRIGIDAEYVQSGEEALLMFDKNSGKTLPFNLLLLDWKMPSMDGIELTRLIREKTNNADITIILTTYNWYEIMEEALLAGVDAFLAKPLFAVNIRDEIGKILLQRRNAQVNKDKNKDLSGTRVILAEDMDITAQIMRQILKLKNIESDYVTNGRDAVNLFNESDEGTYAAILMDIRMPVENGLDATKRIRALDRKDAKTIPIIALTANAFDDDVRMSLDAGMNAHLSKPIEPDLLFETLNRLIHDSI